MRRVLLGLTVTLCAGCMNDAPNRGETISGAYVLRTVNAAALPFTTSGSGSDKTELLDDSYMLYDGLTYAETGHIRKTANGTATTSVFSETGSFFTLGTSLTFRAAGTSVDKIAIYSSNTLTFTESGKRSVYTK